MTPGDRAICALRASVMTALHNHHAERQRALGEGRTTADAVMAQMAEALRMVPPAAVGSAREFLIGAALSTYDAWLMERDE